MKEELLKAAMWFSLMLSPFVILLLLVWKYPDLTPAPTTTTQTANQLLQPSATKYLASACFNIDGKREPWQGNGPDGIVVMRGYDHYLIMGREEAESYKATKLGESVPMWLLDATTYEVACPENWVKHKHTKKGGMK